MIHEMKLQNNPFESIKNGTKKIEMRLYDEKRRKVNIGDYIEFKNLLTNEIIKTKVINLYKFNNFSELYNNFDKILLGYKEDEESNPSDMNKYYSESEQQEYGVVGIEIELIKRR